MCGIIGYVGGGRASEECFNGLKRLEYRGYDSAGIAVLTCGKINIYKRAGKVEAVRPACLMDGAAGIGHTRWATHGAPDSRNAHPHRAGRVALVHNGIIENYAELKAELAESGCVFASDTDSEVAAHLINKYYDGDPLASVQRAAARLKGSFALCVLFEGFEGIIAAKKKSPLVIGFGEGENFVASDIPALAGRARSYCLLADGDCAEVTAKGVAVFNRAGKRVQRRRLLNNVAGSDAELCGYPHFMLKEICESPRVVVNTVQAFARIPESKLNTALAGVKEVIITGCGTAFNSGLAAAEYFREIAKLSCRAEIASEFRYSRPRLDKSVLVIAVSQSGETADTVEAARLAHRRGARVIAVTNAPCSAVARASHLAVPICAGVEVCVAATKSYIAQIAALYLLACRFAERSDAAARELKRVARSCQKLIADRERVEAVGRELKDCSAVFFLGRGIDYAAAREGSLKLKEVSYIFSDGYAAGELKHGTLALVDMRTCSIIISTQRRLQGKCKNAAEQIASRGGRVVYIVNGEAEGEGVIALPKTCQRLAVMTAAIACQLIAYGAATARGIDPDKPRNLAKSVTVE